MTVQVLVVTMNQAKGDYSLLKKMNIQSDVIICNQCNRNEIEEFEYEGYKVKWLSFSEKGVGLNRNNGLMRSTADICILADDDMVFRDNYEKIVRKWLERLPQNDVFLFQLVKDSENIICGGTAKSINRFNFGKYGAARIVFRNKKVQMNGIFFSTMFGGGCQYSCGEDTIFLSHCLEKGLSLVEIPDYIATLTEIRQSTWFEGYTDKFFFDKGVLYYILNQRMCWIYALVHCLKHSDLYKEYKWFKAWRQMCKGIKSVKREE